LASRDRKSAWTFACRPSFVFAGIDHSFFMSASERMDGALFIATY